MGSDTRKITDTNIVRQELRSLALKMQKAADEQVKKYSQQRDYDENFEEYYNEKAVIKPPFVPDRLVEVREDCGVVGACVDAYVRNIHGFGHSMVLLDKFKDEKIPPEEEKAVELAESIFEAPNNKESFPKLRQLCGEDYETLGYSFMEVVRDVGGSPSLFFWLDAIKTRILSIKESVTASVPIMLRRGNSFVTQNVTRQFRKYIFLIEGRDPTYYIEYGCPKAINKNTGKIEEAGDDSATEVIHFKRGAGLYGKPRWTSQIIKSLGLIRADRINFDLFDNQAIPPMMISVSGGGLNPDSMQDLKSLLQSGKGYQNFNRILLLEALAYTGDQQGGQLLVDESAAPPRLDIKSLTEFRKEDMMFINYNTHACDSIRKYGFRLPGLYLGETEEYNYATAKVAKDTTEEQVFAPERNIFDAQINLLVTKQCGVQYHEFKSNSPTYHNADDIAKILPILVDGGVFTINTLIEQGNKIFNMGIPLYEEEFANIPIPIMLQGGQATGDVAVEIEGNEKSAETLLKNPDMITEYLLLMNAEKRLREYADLAN